MNILEECEEELAKIKAEKEKHKLKYKDIDLVSGAPATVNLSLVFGIPLAGYIVSLFLFSYVPTAVVIAMVLFLIVLFVTFFC